MPESVDPQILIGLGLLGLMAHFGLVVAARWLNVVFLVCAAFLLISPISVATDVPGTELLKWVRVYLSVLMVVGYLLAYRTLRFGPASWAFMAFLGFYTIAGIWSDSMVAAIKFKGMYGIVVVSGLLMASSIRDFDEFRKSLRVLSAAAILYGLFILVGLARDPGQILSGRLAVWGWNANRIGHDSAAMFAICLFVGLYDKTKAWKLYGFGLAGLFGFLTLATGSRAAAGMAAISGMVLIAPLFRRPLLLATVAIFGGLLVNVILKSIASSTTERFSEVDFSNRAELWRHGLEMFSDSPFVGVGWVADTSARAGGATANLHSVYIQILAETGVMGAFLFVLCLLVCGVRSLGLLNSMRRFPEAAPFSFFAFGLAGATLAHGVAESSSIQGTNLNGLLLPFAIGLMDRIPQMIREATGAETHDDEAYHTEGGEPEASGGEYADYGEDPHPT